MCGLLLLIQAGLLASLAPLYEKMFRVCPNGVVPNLKLSTALNNLHVALPVYHRAVSICTWAPNAGGYIRMVARDFRDIAGDGEKRTKCLAKAWGLQHKRK